MKKSKKNATTTDAPKRPVQYETPTVHIAAGDEALDASAAKSLLGWEETDDPEKVLLTDRNGEKIHCANNVTNRPLTLSNVESYAQEMLRGRWRLNGECIIIGKTGLLLNGQHTLIALVLAEQDRENGFKDYPDDARREYRRNWENPVTIDKGVFYGIDETDDVVNTMDTCRPRSLWEVICRSSHFGGMKLAERKTASKVCEHAIRLIWHRTGAANAFDLQRTHAESLDFLDRHPTLLRLVKHVIEEDGGNKEGGRRIAKYLSLGYASGLAYLMACSATDGEKYTAAKNPSEKHLDFSRLDAAEEFWLFLADGSPEMKPLRDAINGLANPLTGTPGTLAEKVAVLVKAWGHYVAGEGLTPKRLELRYGDVEGERTLLDNDLDLGGIDRGPKPEADDDDREGPIPTPEEVAANAKAEKERHLAEKRDEKPKDDSPPPTPKKSPKQILREKQEADAKAADDLLKAVKGEQPPAESTPQTTPTADGIDPKTGFKARPKVTINRPVLRGGIG